MLPATQQFEMIVDTGASGTVITQPMAAALGVVAKAKAIPRQGGRISIGYIVPFMVVVVKMYR